MNTNNIIKNENVNNTVNKQASTSKKISILLNFHKNIEFIPSFS